MSTVALPAVPAVTGTGVGETSSVKLDDVNVTFAESPAVQFVSPL
jgi:hypothetical protein